MIIDGYSDKQIAHELNISVPTVRSHLQRMYAKFRVQDRITLVVYIFAWFRHPPPEASFKQTRSELSKNTSEVKPGSIPTPDSA